ncbi:MAG: glycosyltransferase family 4 protein [Thermoleophilia bacterium]
MKPRVLMVGRTRYRLPLSPPLKRKFDALSEQVDVRVLASGANGEDPRFVLVPPAKGLDGALFWASLPARIARELRRFRPDAILAQSPYEAAAAVAALRLARANARVLVDVHGDWRTSTRLYGSPLRRVLGPVADRVALRGLRRADTVRTISDYTTGLVREAGIEPGDVFPAFMDLEPFLEPFRPLPERPRALFVGVLELYKNVDGLADAWRSAAPRVPEATLHVVGSGTRTAVVERLVAELPEQTRWTKELSTEEVAAALDDSTLLVLPSRSEGLGRVIVEALCRGRPVLASAVGGIRDIVRDGENGVLVPPGDTEALADALVRLLSDHAEAERLAAAARPSVEPWLATPEEYAQRVRSLVDGTIKPSP